MNNDPDQFGVAAAIVVLGVIAALALCIALPILLGH